MITSIAPTRISFAGGGTDLPEIAGKIGGYVTSAAISRHVRVSLKERSDEKICISSVGPGIKEKTVASAGKIAYGGKSDLIKSVAEELNVKKKGFDISLVSEVPRHSGLGASGSAFVAVIGAFNHFYNIGMDKKEMAELAFGLERDKLKNKVGRQDQYAAAFGGINFMEFGKRMKITPVKTSKETIACLERNIVLVQVSGRGRAGSIIAKQVGSFSENKEWFVRTKELGMGAKNALESGNMEEFGRILDEAWECKKMFGSVTNDFIDKIYETAVRSGAYGGKISGAGGGGCGFFFCRHGRKNNVIAALEKLGARNIPFAFDFHGLVVDDE